MMLLLLLHTVGLQANIALVHLFRFALHSFTGEEATKQNKYPITSQATIIIHIMLKQPPTVMPL